MYVYNVHAHVYTCIFNFSSGKYPYIEGLAGCTIQRTSQQSGRLKAMLTHSGRRAQLINLRVDGTCAHNYSVRTADFAIFHVVRGLRLDCLLAGVELLPFFPAA